MALSFSRPDPSSPASIADANFSTTRRGFDQEQVRGVLRDVAAELGRLIERERFLQHELRTAQEITVDPAAALDEETVARILGEETLRVLQTARESAAQIKARAEESASRIIREAADEAGRVRSEAEVDAARIRSDASADAEAELSLAKQQGREMVNEARAYRERVLSELARRRDAARLQIEQLTAGRDRLLQVFERARLVAVDVASDLAPLDEPEEFVDLAATTGPIPLMVPADQDPGVTPATGDEAADAAADAADDGAAGAAGPAVDDVVVEHDDASDADASDDDASGANASDTDASVDTAASDDPTVPVEVAGDDPTVPMDVDADDTVVDAGAVDTGSAADGEADADDGAAESTTEGEPVPETVAPESGSESGVEPEVEPGLESGAAASDATGDEAGSAATAATDDSNVVSIFGGRHAEDPAADGAAADDAAADDAVAEDPAADDEGAADSDDVGGGLADSDDVAGGLFARLRAATVGVADTADDPGNDNGNDNGNGSAGTDDAVDGSGAVVEPVSAEASGAVAATDPDADTGSGGVPADVGTDSDVGTAADVGTDSDVGSAAEVGTDSDVEPEETIFQRRDAELVPLILSAARKLKRVLADEQNEALDTLRGRAVVSELDDLVPVVDAHVERFFAAITAEMLAAARAGAVLHATGDTDDTDRTGDAIDASVLAPARELIAGGLVIPLRNRLERSVIDGAGENDQIVRGVRAVYREWKTTHIDEQLDDVLRLAHGVGVGAGAEPGAPMCWAVDPGGPACPDAEDNALAGLVPAGEPYPTGHRVAPAHPGCRCLIAPGGN